VLGSADKLISEGLSADSLLASLIEHLRELLIIRTCGADSALVEAAVIPLDQLAKQAALFDAAVLMQDITILEDLRRQLRQTQAGRALLDATLVRLTMAEQFAAISELLARVDGAGGAGTGAPQKKKPEQAVAWSAEASASPPVAVPAARPVPATSSTTLDDNDDDDLPRPGKVWEGPSVGAILRETARSSRPTPPPVQTAHPEPNIEPVDPNDVKAVWSRVLESMRRHGVGVYSLLIHGQLAGIEDDQAVIRYGPEHETFTKMLTRNGKREMVIEAFTRVLGKAIGVRFEVDQQAAASASAAVLPREDSPQPQPAGRGDEPAAVAAAPQPAARAAPARLMPRQVQEFERDPLIGALVSELGATILKISEDV